MRAILILLSVLHLSIVQAVETPSATSVDPAGKELDPQLLQQLDELIELGLPALAHHVIADRQRSTRPYSPDWYRLQRKLVSILMLQEDWPQVIQRSSDAITAGREKHVPLQLLDWFGTQRAIASLHSGDADSSLKILRGLIWSDANYDRSLLIPLWRQLVMRAFLQQDAISDAQSALLRYDYEYGSSAESRNADWLTTRASVLIRAGRYSEVIGLLREQEGSVAEVLTMLARIRSDEASHASILEALDEHTKGKLVSRSDNWAYRYLRYEIAKTSNDDRKIAAALEDLFSLGKVYHVMQESVDISSDDLWSLYRRNGIELGNAYHLLTGDDAAWYGQALKLKSKDTFRTTALLVALALQSVESDHREMAHTELISILDGKKNSLDLLTNLYMFSDTIDSDEVIPVSTLVRLIDHALDRKSISLAARMMTRLEDVPEDEDQFLWQLRKARVLVLEGQYETGEKSLRSLFVEHPQLQAEQIDHVMQVLFDLQSVQRHEAALEFFRRVMTRELEFNLRREIYYWMADSSFALANYADAAMFYLRSARTEQGGMNDQWALSSRLKAAESLVKAGHYDDARTVYQALLKITPNEARKTMIEQEIQHIYLLESAHRVGQVGT